MAYTLEQLTDDVRAALHADSGPTGRKMVSEHVARALLDKSFVARHIKDEDCKPRKVLYEDPELGFCICAHAYSTGVTGSPHDHGSTWAIYGIAAGTTEMTEWRIVTPGTGEVASLVAPVRSYTMKPGDCHVYEPGDVHSPLISPSSKLIRIEGANLDRVRRSNIKAA